MRDREVYWAFLLLRHYTGEARQDELRVLLVFQSWESRVYGDLKDLKSEERRAGDWRRVSRKREEWFAGAQQWKFGEILL